MVSHDKTTECGKWGHEDIVNSKELRAMCIKLGRTSQKVVDVCKRISINIELCSRSFKYVRPTYRAKPADSNDIVFVVFCEPGSDRDIELPESVRYLNIEYRTIGEYINEDKAMPTVTELFLESEETDKKNLIYILHKTTSDFMKEHSNLNIITASPVKSEGFSTEKHTTKREPCIVFYVCLKGYIPIQEEELPRHLGQYQTDVREGSFALYNDTEKYVQRLKIGCSIGEDNNSGLYGGTGGTLGASVNLDSGLVGCITSAHVLLNENKLFQNKHLTIDFKLIEPNAAATIYQPAPFIVAIPGNQPFGRITRVVYKAGGKHDTGVEAALITIVQPTRSPDNGKFPRIQEGFTGENQLNFMSGKLIKSGEEFETFLKKKVTFYKYGAITGLTKGDLRLEAGAVRTDILPVRPSCELHNQFEICSKNSNKFADRGYSGALVLASPDDDINDLHAIGILTGGTDDFTKVYMSPIWEVLKLLKLRLKLKNFNEPSETDDNVNTYASMPSDNSEIKTIKHEVETKVDNVEAKVNNVERQISVVETKVEIVETKVDKVGSEMKAEMKAEKAEIKAKIKAENVEIKAEMKANLEAIIEAIHKK